MRKKELSPIERLLGTKKLRMSNKFLITMQHKTGGSPTVLGFCTKEVKAQNYVNTKNKSGDWIFAYRSIQCLD